MKNTLGVTLSGALLVGFSGATAHATENPFAIETLPQGYQLVKQQNDFVVAPGAIVEKDKEGKCGQGKCGSEGKCGTKK